jgi:hypothetical protein
LGAAYCRTPRTRQNGEAAAMTTVDRSSPDWGGRGSSSTRG